jgi:hypothetical protein
MRSRIVSIREDPRIWDRLWEEILKPENLVGSSPCVLVMAVQPMNGDDAEKR